MYIYILSELDSLDNIHNRQISQHTQQTDITTCRGETLSVDRHNPDLNEGMIISRFQSLIFVVKDAVYITDKVQDLLGHSYIKIKIINFQRVKIFLLLQAAIINPFRVRD